MGAYMLTARISQYRSNLSSYHNQVLSDHEPLRIVGPSRGDIVVLAAEDYERIQDSISVLKDRATLNSLLAGKSDFPGDAQEGALDMKDVFTDVMDSKNK